MRHYNVISPPVGIRFKDPFHLEFRNLSKTQARDYYDWFLEQIPIRIKVLAEAIQSTPGYENWIPDFSFESISHLEQWFRQIVSKRIRVSTEIGEIYDKSPPWFEQVKIEEWDLSPETYSLCYDIAMYFAQALQENATVLTWKLVTSPPKSIDINQPVLTGLGKVDFNPVHVMTMTAFGFIRNSKKENVLTKLYLRLSPAQIKSA